MFFCIIADLVKYTNAHMLFFFRQSAQNILSKLFLCIYSFFGNQLCHVNFFRKLICYPRVTIAVPSFCFTNDIVYSDCKIIDSSESIDFFIRLNLTNKFNISFAKYFCQISKQELKL